MTDDTSGVLVTGETHTIRDWTDLAGRAGRGRQAGSTVVRLGEGGRKYRRHLRR